MAVTTTATPGIILSFRVAIEDFIFRTASLNKKRSPSKNNRGREKREKKLVVEKSRSFSTIVSLRFGVTRELGVIS